MYIEIFGRIIPTYGALILLGGFIANVIGIWYLKRNALSLDDLILLEAYTCLGGFLGAKILYLIVSCRMIDWSRITEMEYFNALMQGGFVFYGGLIGGLGMLFLAGRIHQINALLYAQHFIFAIPLIHGFGRIGCYCAGCCYGIPYDGVGAVVYTSQDQLAPLGVSLFPVQPLEACCLFLIAALLLGLALFHHIQYTVPIYFISYGIVRFLLEFFRGDAVRGSLWALSTSQWISILMLIIGIVWIVCEKRARKYA